MGSAEMIRAALAELDGRKLERVRDDDEPDGKIIALMRHDVPRAPQLKRDPGLRFPKKGEPLTGDDIPDVIKGLV